MKDKDKLEDQEKIENPETPKEKVKKKRNRLIRFILFLILGIYSYVIQYFIPDMSIILGDFGSIVPLLLSIVSMAGFSWVPILCVLGLVMVVLDEKIGEFSKTFIIIVGVITVVSSLIFFLG